MQPDIARDLIRMFVERILDEVFPGETGAARLRQIGLFTIIYMLQGGDEPVTAARIAELTRQSDSQIHRQLKKLIELDLVERTQVKNKLGRGHAWHLAVKHNAKSRRLAEAIRQASAAMKPE
jgi:DNA-binding IclR family transcriptional regulator